MEGKLIKVEDDYRLLNTNNSIIGTTDLEYQQAFSDVCQKLSLKNCQAIENGYDLDELALDYYKLVFGNTKSYKDGFQKALELLGDNKELIIKLNDLLDGLNSFKYQVKASYLHFDCEEIIKSLQQTEWDVEIEMECPQCKEYGYISECRNVCNKKFIQPKLDTNGCLILKRK